MPHKKYPELLEWEIGDCIYFKGNTYRCDSGNYDSGIFKGIDENYNVFIEEFIKHMIIIVPFKEILQNRTIEFEKSEERKKQYLIKG